MKQLSRLLRRLGGQYIVAPAWPDPDIGALLDRGFVMSGPGTLRKGKKSKCHNNVASLWRSRRRPIVAIGTGYALSDDGLWRQHSWGIMRSGLIETTAPRTKYFGLVLQGFVADAFAARQLSSETLCANAGQSKNLLSLGRTDSADRT